MLCTAPMQLYPKQQEGVRDNSAGWQAAHVPCSLITQGPVQNTRPPALCFTLKLGLCLPWWSHSLQGSVCFGWENVHLVNKWYFDVVFPPHTSTVSVCFCFVVGSFCDTCFHFSENTLGNWECVPMFVPRYSLCMLCECKTSSAQLAASEQYQRKTWFPRASHLFHSHLSSEQQHAAHNKRHTQTLTHI